MLRVVFFLPMLASRSVAAASPNFGSECTHSRCRLLSVYTNQYFLYDPDPVVPHTTVLLWKREKTGSVRRRFTAVRGRRAGLVDTPIQRVLVLQSVGVLTLRSLGDEGVGDLDEAGGHGQVAEVLVGRLHHVAVGVVLAWRRLVG